jgi:hypothetical protein
MPRLAMTAVNRTVSAAILAMALAVSLGACSQGERVFTRQNQAASALATMGMEAEAANALNLDLIYAAEEQLFQACAPLRDVASRRMSGEDVGIDTHLVAFVSLTYCESETERAETFIRTGDPNLAGFYLQTVSERSPAK